MIKIAGALLIILAGGMVGLIMARDYLRRPKELKAFLASLQTVSYTHLDVYKRQATDYADINVSSKVIKIIQSYAKIVNQTTWLKG